jgi:hypothetical protein
MTYGQLLHFVKDYMPKKMQHIYLPLLIGELVDTGGSSTLRQLPQAVLAKDESQDLLYYAKRLKEMPLKALRKHEIVNRDAYLITHSNKVIFFG